MITMQLNTCAYYTKTLATVGFSVCGILRLIGSPEEVTGQGVGGGSRYTFWPLPLIISVTWQKQKKSCVMNGRYLVKQNLLIFKV